MPYLEAMTANLQIDDTYLHFFKINKGKMATVLKLKE